jgi:FkbM family methyltransferase
MKKLIKKIFRKAGIHISWHHDSDLERRIKIINHFNIDTVFDIGANIGQYATRMREVGYIKKIISFEPQESAYRCLKHAALNDKNWIVNKYALGDADCKAFINVAGNSQSSSLLNMLPRHILSNPESKYVAQKEIEIKKLDSIFNSFCNKEAKIMLKVHAQGYEKNVIDGANESLKSIMIIQLQMSIFPLYENEKSFLEMINYIENKGFRLFSLESGYSDINTGELLQVYGIFVRKTLMNKV